MPTGPDLVGLGVPGELAAVLGNTDSTVTCAGTAQATATSIKTHNAALSAASSQTGAILPSAAKIGTPYYFVCTSSTAAVVYVPVGQLLNGTTNGSFTLAQNKAGILWQYKLNNWTSILTA